MPFLSIWVQALLLILSLMSLLWLMSVWLKNASIVDQFWGFGFVVAAWFYFLRAEEGLPARQWLTVLLATIWGLRLTLYLTWRNWGRAEDFRYQAFRRRYGPRRYWWVSFFQVFLLQGVLIWLVSAPLLGAQVGTRGESLNWLDATAVFVWLIGFIFEAGGDWQLARFKANPANRGKLLTSGFWKYTRHPNYFGDAAIWWAFALLSVAAGSWLPLLGALLMTILLLRVSGVALLERSLVKEKPAYADYMQRTSAFLPWPPKKRG